MKMTPEAFHTWSQHLRLTPETEALIASIRSSPPVRRVSGGVSNITGRYPSPKMGMSIQFESDRVEFWAIYTMERDDDMLEYAEVIEVMLSPTDLLSNLFEEKEAFMAKRGPLSDQQLANKYRLGELLGSGGMGAVYKAQDTDCIAL